MQEKQFDALYRSAGARLGLPDCAMWVLYFLISADEELTQQELIGKMMFPKQTINSAVANLVKKKLVKLEMIPGTKNRKKVLLTTAGTELAVNSVGRMRNAELHAVRSMGEKRMKQFANLYSEFFEAMKDAFTKDGLA